MPHQIELFLSQQKALAYRQGRKNDAYAFHEMLLRSTNDRELSTLLTNLISGNGDLAAVNDRLARHFGAAQSLLQEVHEHRPSAEKLPTWEQAYDSRVFEDDKLCTKILSSLTLADIARCTSVCKQWKQTIEGNNVVPMMHFIHPRPIIDAWLVNTEQKIVRALRIASVRKLGPDTISQEHRIGVRALMTPNRLILGTYAGPSHLWNQLFDVSKAAKEEHTSYLSFRYFQQSPLDETDNDAIYLRMYLTQPPCMRITVRWVVDLIDHNKVVKGEGECEVTVHNKNGVTLNDLRKAFNHFRRQAEDNGNEIRLKLQRTPDQTFATAVKIEEGIFVSAQEKRNVESVEVCQAPSEVVLTENEGDDELWKGEDWEKGRPVFVYARPAGA